MTAVILPFPSRRSAIHADRDCHGVTTARVTPRGKAQRQNAEDSRDQSASDSARHGRADNDPGLRRTRDVLLDMLVVDCATAATRSGPGVLLLITVGVAGLDHLREFDLEHVLLIPATSARGKPHGHGLQLAVDVSSAEAALANYCARSGVVRGRCRLQPVKGWRSRVRSPSILAANLFRILDYATDPARQGVVHLGDALAFGAFVQPWRRFLDADPFALWPSSPSPRPCALDTCDRIVVPPRATCSDAHRQAVCRHPERDRRGHKGLLRSTSESGLSTDATPKTDERRAVTSDVGTRRESPDSAAEPRAMRELEKRD